MTPGRPTDSLASAPLASGPPPAQPSWDEPPDPLALLARPDKWFVSGGRALAFAPPFPLFLNDPGFWDAAHYLHFPAGPGFSFVLLDEAGTPVDLACAGRDWRPDRLRVHFEAPGLELSETRVIPGLDALVSRVGLRNTGAQARRLQVLAWSAQSLDEQPPPQAGEAGSGALGRSARGGAAAWREGRVVALTRAATAPRAQALTLTLALGLSGARSALIVASEPGAVLPRLQLTPFIELLASDGLAPQAALPDLSAGGMAYLGVERPLALAPGEEVWFTVVLGVGSQPEAAVANANAALALPDPPAAAEHEWREFFAQVPEFRCDDPYFLHAYYYRFYGLRLNQLDVREGNYAHRTVAEGIGYFRLPVSYSTTAILRETRWLRDGKLAASVWRQTLATQLESGAFPAHVFRDTPPDDSIYHADWGGAFLALEDLHPQDLNEAYAALGRYARFLTAHRDREGSGLIDLVNQWESGQEYMTRYLLADDQADQWRPMSGRLKGVDASAYAAKLLAALSELAERTGRPREAVVWAQRAENTRAALREKCWDWDRAAFMDLAPDGRRGTSLHAVNFYPYLCGAARDEHWPAATAHLLDPREFWTPYPAPSSALDDPNFDPHGVWRGRRRSCPWNGRVWPMANSHVAEVLALAARRDTSLRPAATDFIRRAVRLMFDHNDPRRPNSFEHYNPFTGQASEYRGINDYMHSWIADLIVRFVCGLDPTGAPNAVRLDPLPFGCRFRLSGVRVRGHDLDVAWTDRYRVTLDGRLALDEAEPRPAMLDLEAGGRSA